MIRGILAGAAIVGTLDIVEVIIFYAFRGVQPIRVLQGVAAGLLGRDAFRGGWPVALLGLTLHFTIAFAVVAIYHVASARLPLLTRHPLIIGAAYGLAVFAVMRYVVVPMSAAGGGSNRSWPTLVNVLFAHIACVGIPTALTARRTSVRTD